MYIQNIYTYKFCTIFNYIIFNNGISNNFSLRTNYYTYSIIEKILKSFNTNS